MSEPGLHHGGQLDAAIAEHGGVRAGWLDLSTGINPRPWPVPEIPGESWSRLPDAGATEQLLAAARRHYAVPSSLEVFPAPGTQALIEALPRILPGETTTVIAPQNGTYGEHAYCCTKAGRTVRIVEQPQLVDSKERLAVIVRPNNPDGSVAELCEILALHERLSANDGWMIIDEAFCDNAPDTSLIGEELERAIILRSFGKFFGLAGLRLGFAICPAGIAEKLRNWCGPWAVSGPALSIGTEALADEAWIETTRQRLQSDCARLADLLGRSGFAIAGEGGLFVLGRREDAGEWYQSLCRARILTRAFEHDPALLRFGLPGDEERLARLEKALGEIASKAAR